MARLTQKQKTKLVELVTKHYDKLFVGLDSDCRKQTWVKIASKLNTRLMKRTPEAWRKSMNDIKRQVKIKLAKIQAYHSEHDGEGSSIEVMTDLDLKVEALFARDILELKIESVPTIEPNQTIPMLRYECANEMRSESEQSEVKFIPKKRRVTVGTPLKEMFAESVSIQKECLNVLKDIRNQNSDVVSLLGLLIDQMTDRNDMLGSKDILEDITSSVKEHQSTFRTIVNGVPSNCKTSGHPKERTKSAFSSIEPACKIAKITQMSDTQILSSSKILQKQQIEPPTTLQTVTYIQPQQKQHFPIRYTQPVQPQQQEPRQQKLPIQQPCQQKLIPQKNLILQPQYAVTLQQQPRRQKLMFQPSTQSIQIQCNNPS